jgi:hypothetical protein
MCKPAPYSTSRCAPRLVALGRCRMPCCSTTRSSTRSPSSASRSLLLSAAAASRSIRNSSVCKMRLTASCSECKALYVGRAACTMERISVRGIRSNTRPTIAAWVDARLAQQVHVAEAVPQSRLEVLQVLRRWTQQLQVAITSSRSGEQTVSRVYSTQTRRVGVRWNHQCSALCSAAGSAPPRGQPLRLPVCQPPRPPWPMPLQPGLVPAPASPPPGRQQ